MKTKFFPLIFDTKALNEDGSFSGYASVFGNVDLDGDVIEPGAFKQIIRNDDGKVVVLWQHNQREPIGVADVMDDGKGLKFSGALVLEDATARKARAHMLAKSVRGMSIGFDTLKDEMRDGVRHILEARLWEISVVTFGANPRAQVDAAKHAGQITNIRDYEDFLREVGGFSKAQAKLLAVAWKAMPGQRDADGEPEDVQQLIETFAKYAKKPS